MAMNTSKQVSLGAIAISVFCFANLAMATGNGSSGGGNAVKLDFLASANLAYEAIKQQGTTLGSKIDPLKFKAAIDPNHVDLTDQTLIDQNKVVDAYYNQSTDIIQVNRSGWQSLTSSAEKMRLAAHEIFRRMNLDDDQYQISQQLHEVKVIMFHFLYTIEAFKGHHSEMAVTVSDNVTLPLPDCISSAGFELCSANWYQFNKLDNREFTANVYATWTTEDGNPPVIKVEVNIHEGTDRFDGSRVTVGLGEANALSESVGLDQIYNFPNSAPNENDGYIQRLTLGPWSQ